MIIYLATLAGYPVLPLRARLHRAAPADPVSRAEVFAFSTREPNAEIRAIHPKAMPVILTTPDESDAWLTAPAGEALALQRPLPDGAEEIIFGSRETGSNTPRSGHRWEAVGGRTISVASRKNRDSAPGRLTH